MDSTDAGRIGAMVLALCFVLIGFWDLYAGLYYGPTATVSAFLLSVARRHPILPYLIGILTGHLFWPQQ